MKLVILQQQFLPRLFLKAYHGRTSCFILYWSNMQYTKQAMDFYCQLDILKEHGLTIEDEEDAIKFLHSVSYFRFANYLQPMELNTESHRFAQNSSFTWNYLHNGSICHPCGKPRAFKSISGNRMNNHVILDCISLLGDITLRKYLMMHRSK